MYKNFREDETEVQKGLNKLPKVTGLMQHPNPNSYAKAHPLPIAPPCTTLKPVCRQKAIRRPPTRCRTWANFLFLQWKKSPAVSQYKSLKGTFFKSKMWGRSIVSFRDVIKLSAFWGFEKEEAPFQGWGSERRNQEQCSRLLKGRTLNPALNRWCCWQHHPWKTVGQVRMSQESLRSWCNTGWTLTEASPKNGAELCSPRHTAGEWEATSLAD